jgi:hypothetical protein
MTHFLQQASSKEGETQEVTGRIKSVKEIREEKSVR